MPDTPETDAPAEKFGAWLGSKKFHVASDAHEHPTRSAPLCYDCKHFLIDISLDQGMCAHPGTPRHPVTGDAVAQVRYMRAHYPDHRLVAMQSAHCGLSATLFQPAASAQVARNGADLLADPVEAVGDSPEKDGADAVLTARRDERPHQLGVGGGVALPERRVD